MCGLHLDWRRGICVVFALLACLSISTAAGAVSEESIEATEITLPEDLTKPEVRDLISRLSDDQVRALLISQLDKLASAESEAPNEETFKRSLANLYRRSAIMWAAIPELPHLPSFIVEKLTEGRTASYLWSVLLFMAAIFFGAGAVEWLFRRLFTRPDRRRT